jgi:tellurite resistance protein TerC
MNLWLIFAILVLILVGLDLWSSRRHEGAMPFKTALLWTALWVGSALAFNGLIAWERGSASAMDFLTGYLIEWSLSMDNLFVFAIIFTYFAVPAAYQHRVLFWGIWGAVLLRLVFVLAGTALVQQFAWTLYVFGAFLVYTGFKLAFAGDSEVDPASNPLLRLARRLLPITDQYHGNHFTVRQNGKLFFTPLFLVLLVVESTDVIFAVDSVPAIFGVTTDPFIIYTSNVFAILGLRSFYFLLARFLDKFHYLGMGLAFVLIFIGVKMLGAHWFHIPSAISLGVVASTLALAVAASVLFPKKTT